MLFQVINQRCLFFCGAPMTSSTPGIAAVLSLLIPGTGQIYNGRFLVGMIWMIITPVVWLNTGGALGWMCHVLSAYTAYRYSEKER
jgi:TM2 domain-containing membrane protein YozV